MIFYYEKVWKPQKIRNRKLTNKNINNKIILRGVYYD